MGLLEADLGVELFDRSRRNATLTPAGEVLLQEALELLRQADGLQQRALSFASGQEARLSVALDEALPSLVLADLAKEIAERFPALELTQLNGTATGSPTTWRPAAPAWAAISTGAIRVQLSPSGIWAAWPRACSCRARIRWPAWREPRAPTWPGIGSW